MGNSQDEDGNAQCISVPLPLTTGSLPLGQCGGFAQLQVTQQRGVSPQAVTSRLIPAENLSAAR